MNEFEGSPKTWPPLGMPTGSVRAILTLILVAVVIIRMLRIRDATATGPDHFDLLWVGSLLIALSHYFTTRRFVELSPHVLRDLEDEGTIERERHPLFLPRNSIRVIITLAFAGAAYYLYREGRLNEPHVASLLSLLGAFALGSVVRRITRIWHRKPVNTSAGTLGDLKALVVLVALLVVAIPEFLNSPAALPDIFHKIALAMVVFYVGSR